MELLAKAGVLLWPIVVCSVLGLALGIERVLFFARSRRQDAEAHDRVRQLLLAGRKDDAALFCQRHPGPVAGLLSRLFTVRELPEEEQKALLSVAAEEQMRRAEWGLRPLAVIGRIAPLLGLLGTVVGLVEAFIAFSAKAGQPDPHLLAGGIWQALLTTVAGLAVAIPAILVHEWCEGQADRTAFSLRAALTEVTALVAR